MAALIGDVFSESSRFHNMVASTGLQRQRAHSNHSEARDPHYRNRSASRSRDTNRDAPAALHPLPSGTAPTGQPAQYHSRGERELAGQGVGSTATLPPPPQQQQQQQQQQPSSGASRFPSPPSSASSESASAESRPQNGTEGSYMASSGGQPSASASLASSTAASSTAPSISAATTVIPTHPSSNQIPSPASDTGPRWNNSLGDLAAQANAQPHTGNASPVQTQTTIHIRDLAHVESLARANLSASHGSSILNDPPLQAMKYEISAMPINDVIEMVAALLTKITTTNDKQHDALNRNAAHIRQAQAASRGDDPNSLDGGGENMSPLSSSVLAFHGKNVPAISIMNYLSRIHKYCPTTYEVFLSLLVYFDRMTERVNDMVKRAEDARRQQLAQATQSSLADDRTQRAVTRDSDTVMRDDSDDSDEVDSDLADDSDEPGSDHSSDSRVGKGGGGAGTGTSTPKIARQPTRASSAISPLHQATYFVVDSYNIHRLIIAGVTCASKFFSDVFYTNSRYAKVGGLPLPELNHLELQFLLLNDFRLAVPVEDLEAYATMLVEFYAREVASPRSRPSANPMDS